MVKIDMKRRNREIKCPHIMRLVSFFCRTDKEIYPPSFFQLNEYCMTKEHSKCPFFVRISEKNSIRTETIDENVAA